MSVEESTHVPVSDHCAWCCKPLLVEAAGWAYCGSDDVGEVAP